jgi:hypothetical protein
MNNDWGDHKQRLEFTERVARKIVDVDQTAAAADLSCGDGYWERVFPDWDWQLGDYASGYEYVGPIEDMIDRIFDVDIFFFCETIEHLEDPDYVLRRIREKSKKLILSTPLRYAEMGPDPNPQHYWAWDEAMIRKMLVDSGWTPKEYTQTRYQPGYIFQIWGCE